MVSPTLACSRDDALADPGAAVAWLSPDGRIVAASDAWLLAVGRTREDALGRLVGEIVPEARAIGAEPRPTPLRHTAVHDATGALVGIVQDLGDPVGEVHRLRAQLARARLALQEAEARLDGVPRVAHDLNNVLTALLTCGGEDDHRWADSIHHAAELVSRLTDSPHRPRWVRVDGALLSLRHTLEAIAGTRVAVTMDLGAPGAQVLAIPSELVQLVVNLVTNAAAAMPAGGSVVVRTREGARAESGASPRWFTLTVLDDGPGMTEEIRRRLFEPFFTTKKNGTGGLGLSIVADIVHRWKGTVTVVSRPSAGTRVEVVIPLDP